MAVHHKFPFYNFACCHCLNGCKWCYGVMRGDNTLWNARSFFRRNRRRETAHKV